MLKQIRKFLIIGSGLWLSLPSGASEQYGFGASAAKMEEFVSKCVRNPTQDQMEREIEQMLQQNRRRPPAGLKGRTQRVLGKPVVGGKISEVSLDGFKLSQVEPFDLDVISQLTVHREAYDPLWEHLFPMTQKEVGARTEVHRQCLSGTCKDRKIENSFDLTPAHASSKQICTEALCASKKIFGNEEGVTILWTYLKFGLNLSPRSNVNADPQGFDKDSLKALVAAINLVPGHLRATTLANQGFFRFGRGQILAKFIDQENAVLMTGEVFDPFEKLNFNDKVAALTHEIGHRSAYLEKESLDRSRAWYTAAGWKMGPNKKPIKIQGTSAVTEYAAKNPDEDFAESYALYRLDPQTLKRLSPERYQFMKDRVFLQVEYDRNPCQGIVSTGGSGSRVQPGTAR